VRPTPESSKGKSEPASPAGPDTDAEAKEKLRAAALARQAAHKHTSDSKHNGHKESSHAASPTQSISPVSVSTPLGGKLPDATPAIKRGLGTEDELILHVISSVFQVDIACEGLSSEPHAARGIITVQLRTNQLPRKSFEKLEYQDSVKRLYNQFTSSHISMKELAFSCFIYDRSLAFERDNVSLVSNQFTGPFILVIRALCVEVIFFNKLIYPHARFFFFCCCWLLLAFM
jgi:hypothetical protein